MLFDELNSYCDKKYQLVCEGEHCGNCDDNCTHPSNCPNNCQTCLEQVHFPSRFMKGRLEYDCKKILYYYTCKYSAKYSSEMLYAFETLDLVHTSDNLNIVSIGCGASPELIALEKIINDNEYDIRIKYRGIDNNIKWKRINDFVVNYFENENYDIKYIYENAIDIFESKQAKKINLLIMQYLLSYFYNSDDRNEIIDFYQNIATNIVQYMEAGSIIIINDVNSNNRGRDEFMLFSKVLDDKGISHSYEKRYFDYDIKSKHQIYGNKYPYKRVLFHSEENDFYNPWLVCSSAQIIIKLE